MTRSDAKRILRKSKRVLVIVALSCVNLTDRELEILVRRHMRGHTQEDVAEEMGYSTTSIQKQESKALDKCCEAWDGLEFVKNMLRSAQ